MKLIILHNLSRERLGDISKIEKVPIEALSIPFYLLSTDVMITSIGLYKINIIIELMEFFTEVTILMGDSSEEYVKLAEQIIARIGRGKIKSMIASTYLPIERRFIPEEKFITHSEEQLEKYAKHILEHGYAVIPVLNKSEIKMYRLEVKTSLMSMPEYKNPTNETVYFKAGFGALGNPGSFHNPAVRAIRLRLMNHMIPLVKKLNELENTPGRRLEQLADRLCIRRKGTTMSAESWHRDQAPRPNDTDEVFGGWINLDEKEDQYFSGVPGTHTVAKGKAGFVRPTDDDKKNADKNKKKIVIPPGHQFVFYQNLLHEVVAKKMSYNMLRLFTGFRLTESDKSLFDAVNKNVYENNKEFKYENFNFNSIIEDQGVFPTPSGQYPPMYFTANLRYPAQREPLSEWSRETFKEQCLETVTVSGEKIVVVERFMKSLKDYDLPLYKTYESYEKDILKPNVKWTLPFYGEFKTLAL